MLGRDRKFEISTIKQAIALTTTAGLLFTGCATNAGGVLREMTFPMKIFVSLYPGKLAVPETCQPEHLPHS